MCVRRYHFPSHAISFFFFATQNPKNIREWIAKKMITFEYGRKRFTYRKYGDRIAITMLNHVNNPDWCTLFGIKESYLDVVMWLMSIHMWMVQKRMFVVPESRIIGDAILKMYESSADQRLNNLVATNREKNSIMERFNSVCHCLPPSSHHFDLFFELLQYSDQRPYRYSSVCVSAKTITVASTTTHTHTPTHPRIPTSTQIYMRNLVALDEAFHPDVEYNDAMIIYSLFRNSPFEHREEVPMFAWYTLLQYIRLHLAVFDQVRSRAHTHTPTHDRDSPIPPTHPPTHPHPHPQIPNNEIKQGFLYFYHPLDTDLFEPPEALDSPKYVAQLLRGKRGAKMPSAAAATDASSASASTAAKA